MTAATAPSERVALRWLILGEGRAHPARTVLAALAIAIGVALGFAVHLINGSALTAFGQAVRNVNGDADLQIRAAGPAGLDENLYARAIAVPGIADASPVVEVKTQVTGQRSLGLTVLGVDILRAATVTPALIGQRVAAASTAPDAVFDGDALYLSRAALAGSGRRVGDSITLSAAGRRAAFRIVGILPGAAEGQRIGVVDIAAAQWRLGRLGIIDRVDLKLTEGIDPITARERLRKVMPATAVLSDAVGEERQSDNLSRAYRVNLDMLALVALLTGGFLVYSTQSLSVARRLRGFALMRTIGMARRGIAMQVVVEAVLVGLVGSAAGLALGYFVAGGALAFFGGDLGGGYFAGANPALRFAPGAAGVFLLLGLVAALAGSLLPARAAARAQPAAALRNMGDVVDPRTPPPWRAAAILLAGGAVAAALPAIGGLPLFGYLAMALLLAGGVAAMPWLARTLLAPLSRKGSRRAPVDLAIRRLHGAPGQAAIALCGIVASTALMVAMAVMVTSFRGSVDEWLGQVLSADLYLRIEGSGEGFDPATQARLSDLPGVADVAFSRAVPMILRADAPPVMLIARRMDGTLPMIGKIDTLPPDATPVWFSEPAARLYHRQVGDRVRLPIADEPFVVAGIWRDYARQHGAVAIENRAYTRLTGDGTRTEAAVELAAGSKIEGVEEAIRTRLPPGVRDLVSIARPAALRRLALGLFDRSFAVTYVLEVIAILVGLAGVAATISAQTIARTREFGMLRHLGVSRRQIVAMLATEGALLGAVGGIAGITLGLAMSQVLIHVVNPQSFNWTMTTRLPLALLAGVAAALVLAAAATAMLAGRRATAEDAVRAVRDDW